LDDGQVFVVSKFIEGSDLAARIKHARPGFPESAELVATVAEALHYAHTHGLVHRDVKPGNILIDATGIPFVVDFGLALREADYGKGGGLAGTIAYMSPEQAREEGHRVDGRSDIFSLGVVLYELLAGKRPFVSKAQDEVQARNEVLDLIIATEPRPPRQIDDKIPKELERICLKAMMKRAADRYTTAKDMAEDLRLFLQAGGSPVSPVAPASPTGTPPPSTLESAPLPSTSRQSDSDQRPIRIVPKGLRSFDEHDADFFLELLPGPRDRDGLPDSIRFWKRRIEPIDPDLTFKVGLIYGPSGCGKSSLLKAGLLPRLGKHVLQVCVEATAQETEVRLLRGIRKVCPELPHQLPIVDSLARLRRDFFLPRERKLLLVLDQFEQWLHAKRAEQNTELVSALRQCDGGRVQGLVLVRDDFWLAASRFMRDLEFRLIEGENSAPVDLFEPRHAKKVLMAFGRAYGSLPETADDFDREQEAFLDQSISGLARDGKIISVRLALFAEMIKGKPWIPATLREVGGAEGVGVTFLEETFSASTAPPEHRLHQKAAQSVLKALLPESGTDIKGRMRSRQELLEASGYHSRLRDFDDLIRILNSELRLITPTDPEGSLSEGQQIGTTEQYYQLTHDYLVHSLRDWLTRKQRETRRGRAQLRLAERSALWNAKPENRLLPSALEWANIRLLTRKRDWTEPQRRMMKRAGRLRGSRVLAMSLIGLVAWGAIEGYGKLRATGLVDSLLAASTAEVPAITRQLSAYHRWAAPRLHALAQRGDDNSRVKLHASLALLPVDASQLSFLEKRLLVASPTEVIVIRDALKDHRARLVPKLWSVVDSAQPGDARLLPAAIALADYDANSPHWESAGSKVMQELVKVNPVFLGAWLDALRPVGTPFTSHVAAVVRFAVKQLLEADPTSFVACYPIAQYHDSITLPLFRAEIDKKPTWPWNDPPLDPSWTKTDTTLTGKMESAQGMLAERFAFCGTMPLGDFIEVLEKLRPSGYRAIRCRPYADGRTVRVAAIWTRDREDWRFISGKTATELKALDRANRREGYDPVDVAGYLDAEQAVPGDRYSCVWARPTRADEPTQLFLGLDSEAYGELAETSNRGGREPQSLSIFQNADGKPLHSGIVRRKGQGTGGELTWTQTMEPDGVDELLSSEPFIVDLALSWSGGTPISLGLKLQRDRARLKEIIKKAPGDFDSRLSLAGIDVCLGNLASASSDLMASLKHDPHSLTALRLLAEIRLREKDMAGAKAIVERLSDLSMGSLEMRSWRALVREQDFINSNASNEEKRETADDEDRIDLLKSFDPKRQWGVGEWTKVNGVLVSPLQDGGRIELPFAPRRPYKLRIAVRPDTGSLVRGQTNRGLIIGLIMQGRRFQATFDFEDRSYIENLDGKDLSAQSESHKGRLLEDDHTSVVEIQVAPGSVSATCNGKPAFLWQGDPSQLTLNDYWRTPNPVLFLGAHDKRYRFQDVSVGVQAWSRLEVYRRAARIYSAWGRKTWAQACKELCVKEVSDLLASTPHAIEGVLDDPSLALLLSEPSIQARHFRHFVGFKLGTSESARFTSTCILGLSPHEHVRKAQALTQGGYRPACVNVLPSVGSAQAFAASVWHRPVVTDESKDQLAQRQARAAITLLRMGKVAEVVSLLRHSAEPRLRSLIVNWLSPLGADPRTLAAELNQLQATAKPAPAQGQQVMDAVLFHPETSIRRALILALGTYGTEGLSADEREPLITRLLHLYRNDPDAGIHGATAWVLRQWGLQDKVKEADAQLMKQKDGGERRWFVNSQGQTFAVIEGPVEFLMGSPPSEPDRQSTEVTRRRIIPRRFAIAAQEVSVREYQVFVVENPGLDHAQNDKLYSAGQDGPMTNLSWYDAAAYCNWLSRQEGLSQCYEPNKSGKYADGMKIKTDALSLGGYRLPTEAEWEYACRAGARTSRYYGSDIDLLRRYAWYTQAGGSVRAQPCGRLLPNDLGLFDMLGNLHEWCLDVDPGAPHPQPLTADNGTTLRLLRGGSSNFQWGGVRSASRPFQLAPGSRSPGFGFRPSKSYYPGTS
jgi:formylglycine-generating enzyme required for sulfatase activity